MLPFDMDIFYFDIPYACKYAAHHHIVIYTDEPPLTDEANNIILQQWCISRSGMW